MVASGVPLALHEDGVHIAPHNPWFAMHYASTGLNVLGIEWTSPFLLDTLPYLMTIFALVSVVGRATPPAALGKAEEA